MVGCFSSKAQCHGCRHTVDLNSIWGVWVEIAFWFSSSEYRKQEGDKAVGHVYKGVRD